MSRNWLGKASRVIVGEAAVQSGSADDTRCQPRHRAPNASSSRHAVVPRPLVIGLLEHCGSGNLGDDATVAAALQQIKRRWPHASVLGLSVDPSDSAQRHGIPSHAIRRGVADIKQSWTTEPAVATRETATEKLKSVLRDYRFLYSNLRWIRKFIDLAIVMPGRVVLEIVFLAKSFRVAASLDILIVCGGGQLLDAWGGPWQFPYTLLKWVVLGRLSGAKCYFLNVGAGPLDHRLSRVFIKTALRLAEYVSFRDAKSRALIKAIGYAGQTTVVADNVYALQVPDVAPGTRRVESGDGLTVGISPMAYRDPRRYWQKDDEVYRRYISNLAAFCARLVRDRHRLRLFSSDIWFDLLAIGDLEKAIWTELGVDTTAMVTCEPVEDITDYMEQLSQVDCLVTCKFHGVVFAHLMNVPVLALPHHPKVSTLMHDFDMAEYCVNIDTFDADVLMESFERLNSNRNEIKARLSWRVAQYPRALSAQ
jgi:polysaccharide pyruvyl transferase WcaK-like protein